MKIGTEIMKIRKRKFLPAITLIEVMAATAILVISSIGALSYQYHSARDAQKARAQVIATRIGQMLLEDWKSTGGSSNYDPQTLGLGFSAPLQIPSHFCEGVGNGLGSPLRDSIHEITVDDVTMMVLLTWADVAQDAVSGVVLRQLDITIRFGSTWPKNVNKTLEKLQPVVLTTYVRIDGAGG
jgi:type II secretory pathway pseudopilin PulG